MRIWAAVFVVLGLSAFSALAQSQPSTQPASGSMAFQPILFSSADSTESGPMTPVRSMSGRAFLMSLVVPGSGELFLGNKKMAAIFFGTEAALWSTYLLLNWYSDLRADDYMLFAAAHAGVQPTGKNHQYFVDIEDFENIVSYNDAMLQERRPELMYPEDSNYHWSWDSQKSMDHYERMRLQSDRYESAGMFVIGGIVLNHLVSGIDAIRLSRKASPETSQRNVRIYFAGLPEGGMRVTLWKLF